MSETAESTMQPKLLIVDDVKANLVAFRSVLSKLDIDIETADSGPDALALLLRHEFAAILMDVQMPGMDGYETADLIRDHSEGQPIPIIFITAGDRSETLEFQGYDSGAIDYLFKPVNDKLLVSKVRVLTDLYRHRRELADTADALRRANGQLTGLLQAAAEGVIGLTPKGEIDFVNPSACRLLDNAPAKLRGRNWLEFVSSALRERIGEDFETSELRTSVLRDSIYRNTHTEFLSGNGGRLPVSFSLSAVYGSSDTATGYVLVFQDISDQLQAQAMLRHSADHDELTGLQNRRAFRRCLEQWTKQQRHDDQHFALLYLDLNRFKPINDQFGHNVGDVMLRNIAWRMSKIIRSDDRLARVGGDEFVALIHAADSLDIAMRVANKLLTAVEEPVVVDGLELQCGVSIGVAIFPEHGVEPEVLIRNADAAMYRAKSSGTTSIVLVDEQLIKTVDNDNQ